MLSRWTAAIMAGASLFSSAALAGDEATPEEVIAKVTQAAADLAERGEAGLSTFDQPGSEYVWKDSYVFVWDCGADLVVAHPVAASQHRVISSLEDVTGMPLGKPLCDAARVPGGSWAEYMWPKPVKDGDGEDLVYTGEPARKVTYMLSVNGHPYQVGAGVYNDGDTVEQLDALTAE